MYSINKKFKFSASHIIDGLPEGHKCGRLHGHNYIVELTLQHNALDEVGFVRDFGDLDKFKTWLNDRLDHRHLNDILLLTTAETIAEWIYRQWKGIYPELIEVKVWETDNSWGAFFEH